MAEAQHRALIENGPHAGVVTLPGPPQDMVRMCVGPDHDPVSLHRYLRQRPQPDDFVQGWEARYRWDPPAAAAGGTQ